MIALALLLCIGDSNVAGWGLPADQPSFAEVLDCEPSAHPGFGVLRGGPIVMKGAVHEAAVRARWSGQSATVILSIGANDIAWTTIPSERIAATIGKRYREAQAAGRVLVIEPAVMPEGDGPVATTMRERRAAVVAALPSYVDPRDIVDTDGLDASAFSDPLHWNLTGHLAVVEAVLGALER